MAGVRIVAIDLPTEQDRLAVLAPLVDYNMAHAGPHNGQPVALLLNDQQGNTTGGLWGHTAFDWMFVQYLVVPAALRRQRIGTALMAQAEAVARQRGCTGIWLDTYSFQARGFYERLGFIVFGSLDAYPAGHQRHFLQKRLPAAVDGARRTGNGAVQ